MLREDVGSIVALDDVSTPSGLKVGCYAYEWRVGEPLCWVSTPIRPEGRMLRRFVRRIDPNSPFHPLFYGRFQPQQPLSHPNPLQICRLLTLSMREPPPVAEIAGGSRSDNEGLPYVRIRSSFYYPKESGSGLSQPIDAQAILISVYRSF
jgi:hypothetical protein